MSIYNDIFSWFFDNPSFDIPNNIKANLSKLSIHFLLNFFLYDFHFCAFFNKHYNNYNFASLDKELILKTIKYFLLKRKYTRNSINYSKLIYEDKNETIKEIMKKFPYIKKEEAIMIKDKYLELTSTTEKTQKKKKVKQKKLKLIDIENIIAEKKYCENCILNQNEMIKPYSNKSNHMNNIDIMFISSLPKEPISKAFSSKEFTFFKKYITKYIKPLNLRYLLLHNILCQFNLNNRNNIKNLCLPIIDQIIEMTNPRLIVSLGVDVSSMFEIDFPMKEIVNKVHFYKNKKIITTYHPFVIYNKEINSNVYDDLFSIIISNLGG